MMEVASPLTGRRGVCLPFSDFCKPLLFDNSATALVLSSLLDLAKERNWKYFELRSGNKPATSAISSAAYYEHQIDLTADEDRLFARFASSVRRAVRKASQNGVEIEISHGRDAVLAFFALHTRTRRRHGLPPQPLKFFLNIHEELMKKRHAFVVLARHRSRPIAAAVFLRLGQKALYKYGASDERYQEFRANDLVMWEGMKFLVQKGARTLHLGRTSIENKGLRRFKLGWGVIETMLHYFQFDVATNSWLNKRNPRTLHKKVFSRLPLKLNQLAGAMLYPHLD